MGKEKTIWDELAFWLLFVGGLNWGLTVFGMNIVDKVVEAVGVPLVGTIVYAAVGASALLVLYRRFA